MAAPLWLALSAATLLLVYAAAVAVLVLLGRRSDARALAGFIPDCLVLVQRLLRDPAVPRARKFALGLLIAYLALPIDLVPDFIPIAGQLDDAILAALVLRFTLRGADPQRVAAHWPGPAEGLRVIVRLAFGRRADTPADGSRAKRRERMARV